MEKPTRVFSFKTLEWLIKELGMMYSVHDHFFSKKRIESGIAFIIGQIGMVYWILKNVEQMTSSDIALWAGIEFAIAGYIVHTIQKEKKVSDSDN
jgi:hypothetical protein